MKTLRTGFASLAVISAMFFAATLALAITTPRYLHIRVSNLTTHELVRVNVPLTLAEQVIPAVNHGKLRDGKVQIGDFSAGTINLRAILNALKTSPEGEFVTVQDNKNDVRVAKVHGQVIVHVIDKQGDENVDVTIPWPVAQALVSETSENQLNVEAAIKALENVGDTTLVRVTGRENVRIWVDSENTDQPLDGVVERKLQ